MIVRIEFRRASNPTFTLADSTLHITRATTVLALHGSGGHPPFAKSAFTVAFWALCSALSITGFALRQVGCSSPGIDLFRVVYT